MKPQTFLRSILRQMALAALAAPLLIACAADDSTGTANDEVITCSVHSTCGTCSAGINCFWAGGCCVPLSVNDRFPNGGVVAGEDYATSPRQCSDYASHNGESSITRAAGTCGSRAPAPAPRPAPAPSTDGCVTVTKDTQLAEVTTLDKEYGCFSFEAYTDARVAGSSETCSGCPGPEIATFKLCATPDCAEDVGDGSALTTSSRWRSQNAGYYSTAPRSRLLLTASSSSGKPIKVCYRKVKHC